MKPNTLLELFDATVLSLKKSDRIAIIHDKDPDGICSAVILSELIERVRGKPVDVRINSPRSSYVPSPSQVSSLRKKKITHIFSTDLSLDSYPELVKSLSSFAKLFIIDHHKLHPTNMKNVVLFKPQYLFPEIKPNEYCTAKLVYDLSNRIADLQHLDWLAAVGSIADMATGPWKKWISSVFKKYKISHNNDFFRTKFGKIATMINNACIYDIKNAELCFFAIKNSKNPDAFIRSRVSSFSNAVEKEITKWIKSSDQAEWNRKLGLIWYSLNPSFPISSVISTILSLKHQDYVVIVIRPEGKFYSMSARCQDRHIAVNDLLEKATKGLKDAHGGGHIPAAGGQILKTDLQIFKKRVIAELEKNLNNT